MPKKRSSSGRRAKAPAPRKRATKRAPVLAARLAAKRVKRTLAKKPAVSILPAPTTPSIKPSVTTRSFAVLAVILFFTITAGALIRVGQAATFQGPTNDPPQGNIPVTIWNRVSTGTQQPSAAIDIDGYINVKGGGPPPAATGLTVGSATLDLGIGAAGQNVIYGVADDTKMHAGDNLLLLQAPSGTNRLSVNKVGDLNASGSLTSSALAVLGRSDLGSASIVVIPGQNLLYGNIDTTSTGNLMLLQTESVDRFKVDAAGNVTSSGNLKADACFGPTFAGVTAQTFTGNLNGAASGYYNANALCVAAHGAGSHVCSVDEIFNSIKCATATSPIKTVVASTDAWIQGGPPGYTAPANDCQGWSSSAPANLGRIWRYDPTDGGKGFLTTCNQTIPFSCCK